MSAPLLCDHRAHAAPHAGEPVDASCRRDEDECIRSTQAPDALRWIKDMQPFLHFEVSDDDDDGDVDADLQDERPPMTIEELAVALIGEDYVPQNTAAPSPPLEARQPETDALPLTGAARDVPDTSGPASAPRHRRIAAPRSERGHPELEVDEKMLSRLSRMTLMHAMPTPFEVIAEQGFVPAPLSHAPLQPSGSSEQATCASRKHDGATRKRRASERTMREARSVKHFHQIKTNAWSEERYWKGRVLIHMFTQDGQNGGLTEHGVVHPIITRDQAILAEALLDKAARQAAKTHSCGRNMPTGSAALWAVVCSLEAFARMNPGGYVVASEHASFVRSWAGIEDAYEQLKRCEEMVPEDRYGLSATHRFRPGYTGTTPLVRRSTGGHSFGNAKEKRKKIKCLDMLLREAGDQGLHYDITTLKPPTIIEYDTPSHSCITVHQAAAKARWNAKVAARAASKKAIA